MAGGATIEQSPSIWNPTLFYATVLIVLVFIPLLGLSGVVGRLFAPIAIATIISMTASFVVSLTAIPVLCSLVLKVPVAAVSIRQAEQHDHSSAHPSSPHADGRLVRALKWLLKNTILRLSLRQPAIVLAIVSMLLALA